MLIRAMECGNDLAAAVIEETMGEWENSARLRTRSLKESGADLLFPFCPPFGLRSNAQKPFSLSLSQI
jgi:hypothetical protein